jgi:hypothetical protein
MKESQMGVPFQVTFDAASPKRLAEFWKIALNYRTDDPPPEFSSWEEAMKSWGLPDDWDDANAIIDPDGVGPRLWFQRVPEGKVAKNRVHLDVSPARGIADPQERWSTVLTHVERLVGAGGTVVEEPRGQLGEHWMVMTDPEGNEFCVQ